MNLQSKFGYCMTTRTLNIALCQCPRNSSDRRTNGQECDQSDLCIFQPDGLSDAGSGIMYTLQISGTQELQIDGVS